MTSGREDPVGYRPFRNPGAVVFTRAGAHEWVETALKSHPSLYAAAGRSADLEVLGGRAQVRVVSAPDGDRWVVRHYRRGGLIGPLWGDRYLRGSKPRPIAELEASAHLQKHKIRTPEIVAAAVYTSGAFYRGDLVTEWIEGLTLIEALRSAKTPEIAGPLFNKVGAVISAMAQAGAYHVDLNAHNVLIDANDSLPWVLDLDRMRLGVPTEQGAQAMRARLLRSLTKLEVDPGLLKRVGDLVVE